MKPPRSGCAKKASSFTQLAWARTQGAPIPVFDAAGRKSGYKKDASGQVIVTQLNESHLADIAEAGGGKYQRATPGGKELDLIWSDLSQMEKTEFGQMQFTGYEDRFAYFVFPALLLLDP